MVPGGTREFVQWLVPTMAKGASGTSSTNQSACAGGAVGSGGFVWPADNHFLSGNDYWSGHLGIDIAAGEGAPIYAADSGVVTMAQGGYNYGYGNVIQIDHGNGYSTVYAHLSVSAWAYAKVLARVNGSAPRAPRAMPRVHTCTLKSGRTVALSIPGLYYLKLKAQKVL